MNIRKIVREHRLLRVLKTWKVFELVISTGIPTLVINLRCKSIQSVATNVCMNAFFAA